MFRLSTGPSHVLSSMTPNTLNRSKYPTMIDSHCHFDFSVFDHDRDDILQRCITAGIKKIVVPGTQASTWSKVTSLCEKYNELEFALGIHPFFISSATEDDLRTLENRIEENRHSIVAIGEIGLDFAATETHSKQVEFFQHQLTIANKNNLPVIIHHRKSHNELIRLLKVTPIDKGGVIHAFSGSYYEAKTYLDLGFRLGVGGTITYQRASKTREVIKKLPIESLLLETDAPDMPIYGRQGQRNSPEFLPEILQALCDLKSMDKTEVVEKTSLASIQLFDLE